MKKNKNNISKKPVKEGDLIEVEIEGKAKFGDGITCIGDTNYRIIVKGAEEGEVLRVRIYKVTKNVAFARVEDE